MPIDTQLIRSIAAHHRQTPRTPRMCASTPETAKTSWWSPGDLPLGPGAVVEADRRQADQEVLSAPDLAASLAAQCLPVALDDARSRVVIVPADYGVVTKKGRRALASALVDALHTLGWEADVAGADPNPDRATRQHPEDGYLLVTLYAKLGTSPVGPAQADDDTSLAFIVLFVTFFASVALYWIVSRLPTYLPLGILWKIVAVSGAVVMAGFALAALRAHTRLRNEITSMLPLGWAFRRASRDGRWYSSRTPVRPDPDAAMRTRDRSSHPTGIIVWADHHWTVWMLANQYRQMFTDTREPSSNQ